MAIGMLHLGEKNRVISSEGWIAWAESRSAFVYEDETVTIKFEHEVGFPSAVYFETGIWCPKSGAKPLVEKEALRKRVAEALKLLGNTVLE
jgi:hypothetical protein